MTQTQYDFLDDADERRWLTDLDPQAVWANAHRMYGWMREQGVDVDSFLRELAFTKAADALGVDYDVLYEAWLNETALTQTQQGESNTDRH